MGSPFSMARACGDSERKASSTRPNASAEMAQLCMLALNGKRSERRCPPLHPATQTRVIMKHSGRNAGFRRGRQGSRRLRIPDIKPRVTMDNQFFFERYGLANADVERY